MLIMLYKDPVCHHVLSLPLPTNTKVVPITQRVLLPHCIAQLWRVYVREANSRRRLMRRRGTRRRDEWHGGRRLRGEVERSVQMSGVTEYLRLHLRASNVHDAKLRVVTATLGTAKEENLAALHATSTRRRLESWAAQRIMSWYVMNDKQETPRKTERQRRRGGQCR